MDNALKVEHRQDATQLRRLSEAACTERSTLQNTAWLGDTSFVVAILSSEGTKKKKTYIA